MILVDTSVWVDHLRRGDASLSALLLDAGVLTHPFVVGEIACGHLCKRQEILSLLDALPIVPVASDAEVRYFIEENALMGRGIGYIDAHLLASTALSGSTRIWTRDRRLAAVADDMSLSKLL